MVGLLKFYPKGERLGEAGGDTTPGKNGGDSTHCRTTSWTDAQQHDAFVVYDDARLAFEGARGGAPDAQLHGQQLSQLDGGGRSSVSGGSCAGVPGGGCVGFPGGGCVGAPGCGRVGDLGGGHVGGVPGCGRVGDLSGGCVCDPDGGASIGA